MISRTFRPTSVLLVLLVLGPLVPAVGFPDRLTTVLFYALLITFILTLGWGGIIWVGLFADIYTSRLPSNLDENLRARAQITQVRVLARAIDTLIVLVTIGTALMTIPEVRQYGVSLFASAGAAGIVVGLAARPLLSNLIAGVQIAFTQAIRLEDAVVVEGEWGWIEEITSTYVTVRIWDLRRLILPLTYFIERPFQNWTHHSSSLIGSVFFYVDWSVPVDRVRQKLTDIAQQSQLWDGATLALQVTDISRTGVVELRALVSARNAARTWDLRCEVREKLMVWLQQEFPYALPRVRVEVPPGAADRTARAAAGGPSADGG